MGRTGTFIVIDNILEQIEKEKVVDIPGAITKIRQKRMKMVQTHVGFKMHIFHDNTWSFLKPYRINSFSSMMPFWSLSLVETHKSQLLT